MACPWLSSTRWPPETTDQLLPSLVASSAPSRFWRRAWMSSDSKAEARVLPSFVPMFPAPPLSCSPSSRLLKRTASSSLASRSNTALFSAAVPVSWSGADATSSPV